MPDQARERRFAEILFERLGLTPSGMISGERPDLRFEIDGKSIGMEITECTPEEYYRAGKIAEKLGGPVVYCTSLLGESDERRSKDELFQDMFNTTGYVDMNQERRKWCERLRKRIVGKRTKLNSDGFAKFDENWLLVWDNIGLSDNIVTLTEIQGDVLATRFQSETGEREFDHVYVLSGGHTFDIIPGKVAFLHENAAEINAWLNGEGGEDSP